MLAIALVGFLLGGAALYVALGSPDLRIALLSGTASEPGPAAPLPSSAPTGVPLAASAARQVAEVAEQQGGLDQRVAAMEQRITRLDLQAQAAAGNAARAEGLLIAFATRRAIERGAPLGYLADQLRLRFGEAQPRAVRTIIDASVRPVLLDQLLARLDGLAPALHRPPAAEGLLGRFSRELGSLFVVRREDAPSPAIDRRLERARLFLESGRAGAAAAEVRLLPNAAEAADWISDAESYAATQLALESIETAAVLEPRQLRDRTGAQVEQLSPVGG
ncbi:MAG: hypothetical protein B7Z08_10940 [Sphingomonadales bacterium 32-68-7]|nr:MAG: hypothetical protein B7Z33_10885 [Sphingomonadales bacterium 12-68-11]OYX08092.1 MAG: hypothetical protein B7Z08_10940 [Sphingomonadales bacterium 32-68-7]